MGFAPPAPTTSAPPPTAAPSAERKQLNRCRSRGRLAGALTKPFLDYSTNRISPLGPRLRRLIFPIILSAVLVTIAYSLLTGPTSGDIRIDTGDLRYRYLGIPITYRRMPEPQRSALLALAAQSSILKPEWHQCVSYPLHNSNNTDLMCREFYFCATVWAKQDQRLARAMLEDVARYIIRTRAASGLPLSSWLLSGVFVSPDDHGNWVLKPDWAQDEEAIAYLQSKGLGIPTTRAVRP